MSIIGWLPLVASAYLLDELSRPCGLSKLRGAPSRWRWGGCEIHSPVSGRLPTPQAAPQVIHQIFVLSAVRDAYTNTCDFCGPSLSDSEVGSREKSCFATSSISCELSVCCSPPSVGGWLALLTTFRWSNSADAFHCHLWEGMQAQAKYSFLSLWRRGVSPPSCYLRLSWRQLMCPDLFVS